MVANEEHNTQYKLNRIEVSMKKNQGLLSTEAHHASQKRVLSFSWRSFSEWAFFAGRSIREVDQRHLRSAVEFSTTGPARPLRFENDLRQSERALSESVWRL